MTQNKKNHKSHWHAIQNKHNIQKDKDHKHDVVSHGKDERTASAHGSTFFLGSHFRPAGPAPRGRYILTGNTAPFPVHCACASAYRPAAAAPSAASSPSAHCSRSACAHPPTASREPGRGSHKHGRSPRTCHTEKGNDMQMVHIHPTQPQNCCPDFAVLLKPINAHLAFRRKHISTAMPSLQGRMIREEAAVETF